MIREWNKLDNKISKSESLTLFRSSLLKIIRKPVNSVFGILNPVGIQYLTRLRLDFSHLKEHKYHHNFADTLNPLCNCSLEAESVSHFFMRCNLFHNERLILMNNLLNIDPDIHLLDEIAISNLLLYGDDKYNLNTNFKILTVSIDYILSTKRFDGPLL